MFLGSFELAASCSKVYVAAALLSLILALALLRQQASRSFMYAGPTIFGYSPDRTAPDSEADILAIVDGLAYACEVKSSWHSLGRQDIASFEALAKKLRPDIAMPSSEEWDSSYLPSYLQTPDHP
ncbi:hypothetical protein [Lysobacter antibioticus]|uniref:hypothetical protein n=1 Tax=Lysobacter antibioticus TaxID=84531 RepID=UPI0007165527|nr:hypothetical protein [Lysobacter antibioticus]